MPPPCEKSGQPPLSDLGDPLLEEKQQRKRTRRARVPAPRRRSRRLNPNPDTDIIRHGKPEKRVRIHPKKEEKQVSSSDFYNDIGNWHDMTFEEHAFYEEHFLKSDVSKINSLHLLRLVYIYIHAFHSFVVCCFRALMFPPCVGLSLLV